MPFLMRCGRVWRGLLTILNRTMLFALLCFRAKAAGRFLRGADISQFEERRGSADAVEVYNATMGRAYEKLAQVLKPTIAKIAGYCIGGGLATALCCDLRIASDDSSFAIPAAKLGLGYGYGALKPLVESGGSGQCVRDFVHGAPV